MKMTYDKCNTEINRINQELYDNIREFISLEASIEVQRWKWSLSDIFLKWRENHKNLEEKIND